MRFLHTADLHFGASRDLPDYLDRQIQSLVYIYETASREDCAFVLISGDIFHRSDIKPKERDAFVDVLAEADTNHIQTYIIPGNHDMVSRGDYNQIRLLGYLCEWGNFRYVTVFDNEPAWSVNEDSKAVILGVPFQQRPKVRSYPVTAVKQCLQKVDLDGYQLIVMAHDIHGGACEDTGYCFDPDKHSVMTLEDRHVAYWALGDIHRQQRIRENMWYSGAPIQHKFTDDYDTRGFLIIDLDEGSLDVTPMRVEGISRLASIADKDSFADLDENTWVDYTGTDEPPDDARVVRHRPKFPKDVEVNVTPGDDILDGLESVLASYGLGEKDLGDAMKLAHSMCKELG